MKENEIALREERAMVMLPENCVEATIVCKIYLNGAIREVQKTLDLKEVQQAVRDAELNYAEDDDTYTLTEKGMQYLNMLEHAGKTLD